MNEKEILALSRYIANMNTDDLYDLGKVIGGFSHNSPEITHRIGIGMRDIINTTESKINFIPFGPLLEELQRYGTHQLKRLPMIPYTPMNLAPSGSVKK